MRPFNVLHVTYMEVLLQHLDLPLFWTLLQRKLSQLENDLNHLQRHRARQVSSSTIQSEGSYSSSPKSS